MLTQYAFHTTLADTELSRQLALSNASVELSDKPLYVGWVEQI